MTNTLIKKTTQTVKPIKRSLHGLVLLDKPTGMSSNDALQKVKRLFKAKKAGHTGSLDPLATGMLPICFGEATKLCHYLLEVDKTYQVTALLGVRTDTSDSEGDVVSTKPVPALSEQDIENFLQHFRGELKQVPSMYSALKHKGVPLYKLARQGISVDRPARDITIYRNILLGWDAKKHLLTLEVSCSKGTYIRSLVDDLGELIGCGAHVTALRRLSVAGFDQQHMIGLEQLQLCDKPDDYLLPLSAALNDWFTLSVSAEQLTDLRLGRSVSTSVELPQHEWIRVFNDEGQMVAVAEALGPNQLKPKRVMVFEGS